jgi:hypothetical protein
MPCARSAAVIAWRHNWLAAGGNSGMSSARTGHGASKVSRKEIVRQFMGGFYSLKMNKRLTSARKADVCLQWRSVRGGDGSRGNEVLFSPVPVTFAFWFRLARAGIGGAMRGGAQLFFKADEEDKRG